MNRGRKSSQIPVAEVDKTLFDQGSRSSSENAGMPRLAEVVVQLFPALQGGRRSAVVIGYMPHAVVHGGNEDDLAVKFADGPDGSYRQVRPRNWLG
jgi:hypothetical protein